MSVWRNSRRIHKFVYEGMSRWQRTQFLWRSSYHVTEAIAQLCWEGGQKDDSWPVFGQFWHEWVDLFLEVLLTLLTSWVDLFWRCWQSPTQRSWNRRSNNSSAASGPSPIVDSSNILSPQLSPVVREFQSWRKLMDSFLKTRWWLMQTTFGVGKQGNRKIANCFLLHHRWWSSSWNTRATLWSGAKNLSCASRSVQTFVYSAKRQRQRRWQKQWQKQRQRQWGKEIVLCNNTFSASFFLSSLFSARHT